MTNSFSVWHIDGDTALKRRVRVEVIGKTFALYEHQWRSEVYYFGDLVHIGRESDSEIFGLDDDIKPRPDWRIGIEGDIPSELAELIPAKQKPLLSDKAMLIVAFLCLVIVYFALA